MPSLNSNPNCPECGTPLISRGKQRSGNRRFNCKKCFKSFTYDNEGNRITKEVYKDSNKENTSYEQGKNFINIICASKRMLTKEEVIKQFKIDLSEWEIDSFKVKTSEGYRKDRKVDWDVKDGVVTNGKVRDTGKMLIVPLYHIEVKLKRKVEEIELRDIKKEIIQDIKKFAPKYPKITYLKIKDKFLLEPDMPDLHYGKLSWAEESGEDFDIKIAEECALDNLSSLINQSSIYSINKILFPIGNDYFNVNSKLNTTVHDTPQQEDTRWQKTFKKGRELAVKMIDTLSTIAPVEVLVIPGNHDEERTFYMGDALECWYHNSSNVKVDNRAVKRKYFLYGKNLIGLTHGYYEKLDNLPLLMSLEQPEWWALSKFREWQTGDKHYKKEIKTSLKENESTGVMVRILRSLTANDAWLFDKGYVGGLRGAEAFVRHFEKGLIAQFTSSI